MKPKGTDIVGWSNAGGYDKTISVLAEKDVDYRPPAFVGINKEDAEWLIAVLMRAVMSDGDA